MSSRLDAIKARAELVAGKPDNCEPTEKEWAALTDGAIHDVPALVAAVEAVLELHAETYPDLIVDAECPVCVDSTGTYAERWPCPTVTAIHKALGEGGQ